MTTKAEEPQRRTDQWHFEKRLSLDTLVSVAGISIVLGGPVLFWGLAMERRVQVLEANSAQSAKQEAARDIDARDQRISILSRMDTMSEQITQLRIEVGKMSQPQRESAVRR